MTGARGVTKGKSRRPSERLGYSGSNPWVVTSGFHSELAGEESRSCFRLGMFPYLATAPRQDIFVGFEDIRK